LIAIVIPPGYAAGMDEALNVPMLVKGQMVEVTHLQGTEIGEVDSVNYQTGKVLVYFNYEACPHFTSFNLNQVKPIKPRLVSSEETSLEDQIRAMTPSEKSKMADRIYDHILKIMDRKIKGLDN
jgi:hypothetical protein